MHTLKLMEKYSRQLDLQQLLVFKGLKVHLRFVGTWSWDKAACTSETARNRKVLTQLSGWLEAVKAYGEYSSHKETALI